MTSNLLIISLLSLQLGAFAPGCSLVTTDFDKCNSNDVCRVDFGPGFTCNSDGLCEQAEIFNRCTKTLPDDLLTDPVANKGRIIIGNLMDRSVLAHQGRENSSQLAFKQANDEGGVDGRLFGVVFCTVEVNSELDDLARTDAAVASALFLVDTIGVPAIVGPAASSDTQAVFQALRGKDVMVISPSATSPALSDLDPVVVSDEAPGLLWRTAPPDSFQGQAIAFDMMNVTERGNTMPMPTPLPMKVAVIHETGAYGAGLQAVFTEAFAGGSRSFELFPYDDDAQLSLHTATVGTDLSFDEVLFISSQASVVVDFLNVAASNGGFDAKQIFLTDGGANQVDVFDKVLPATPSIFSRIRGTRPAPLDEATSIVYATFLAGYTTEFGADAKTLTFTAQAYDAAWLTAYGVYWAQLNEGGVITGTNIAKGLRKMSAGIDVKIIPTGWNLVRQRFEMGESINVSGASGELDYDPATEETSSDIEIWVVQVGTITADYTWPQ